MPDRETVLKWQQVNAKLIMDQFYTQALRAAKEELAFAGWPGKVSPRTERHFAFILRLHTEEPIGRAERGFRSGIEDWVKFFEVYEIARTFKYVPDRIPEDIASEEIPYGIQEDIASECVALFQFAPVPEYARRYEHHLFQEMVYRIQSTDENVYEHDPDFGEEFLRNQEVCAGLIRLIYEANHDEALGSFAAILAPPSVASERIPEFAAMLSQLSVEDPSNPRASIKEPLLTRVLGFIRFVMLFEEFAELIEENQLALQNLSLFYAYWLESLDDVHIYHLESAAKDLSRSRLLAESSVIASIAAIRTLREHLHVPA